MMSVVSAQSGHVLADQRDPVEIALARIGAPHRLQDRAGSGLERQVDVLAERLAFRVGQDHVLAHVLGVRARVADALDALDRVHPAEELGERQPVVAAQVAPVSVHVLAKERDLADPVPGKALDLCE